MTWARNVRTAEQVQEALQNAELHKTAFAMGCFWGPDSRFGAMPGVHPFPHDTYSVILIEGVPAAK